MTTTAETLPPHGGRPRYAKGCRCTPCREANKRYCKQYRVKTIRKPVRIDATPVRERLQSWAEQGYSQTQIGAAVGKNSGEISRILNGQPTIAPTVATRLLRAPAPTGIPANARVDSTGTVRRGRALHAIGYPIYEIAHVLPAAANHLAYILEHPPATVPLALASAMTALYRRRVGVPGPSQLAIRDARRRKWHGPLAWDDIDDPNCMPESMRNRHKIGPGRKASVDPERVAELTAAGKSAKEIAFQLGCHVRTVTRARGRINPDTLKEAA
jgi:transcriptional regulator with XRE-family HTH domain